MNVSININVESWCTFTKQVCPLTALIIKSNTFQQMGKLLPRRKYYSPNLFASNPEANVILIKLKDKMFKLPLINKFWFRLYLVHLVLQHLVEVWGQARKDSLDNFT